MFDEIEVEEVKARIEAGDVYAEVVSVSRSGMSRRIRFFVINDGRIERITHIIHGDYKQGKKYVNDDGMSVIGCGMDMVFHTLYNFLGYERAKNWSKQYHIL